MKRKILLLIFGILLIFWFTGCQASCGDGICQRWEQRRNSCSIDCQIPREPSGQQATPQGTAEDGFSLKAGDYDFTITSGGIERLYNVHVPSSYNVAKKTPVIINMHGGGGDIENQKKQSGMNAKSDSAGFIVVYPLGTGKTINNKVFGTWNAGRCCGYAKDNDIDDVKFISDMIEDLKTKFNIDEKGVYATGLSNGALMSYRLACELSEKISAIAPVGAQDAFDNCNPTRKVPVIHFHGTDDPAAKFNGGQCGGRLSGDPGWDCRSVAEYIDEWRTLNGCLEKTEIVYQKGEATCEKYLNCEADVELCTIQGGGHTWPSGQYAGFGEKAVGKISHDISANDVMWDFFEKHPME